jgi:hypothetical protein
VLEQIKEYHMSHCCGSKNKSPKPHYQANKHPSDKTQSFLAKLKSAFGLDIKTSQAYRKDKKDKSCC